jgi:hypothetical protein
LQENHHGKQNKPDLERQISHVFSYMWNLYLNKWHGCKRGRVEVGREQQEAGECKERVMAGEYNQSTLYPCMQILQ